MNRPLCCLMVPALLLAGLALGTVAQETGGTKKSDAKKTEPAKGKDNGTSKAKDNKWSFPPGTVIIVPKDFEKGLPTWPGVVIQRLEDYLKLKETADKQKAKSEKKLAHSCELSGRLEGDYVALRGEYTFATEEPRTTVILGLQGGQLTEKSDLDGKVPLMDYTDTDGFTASVDEPGTHQLVLHLRVPVKRPPGGTGLERALELGLPGTVITTIALELPPAIKEVRCNNDPEKTRTAGKWLFAVGKKQVFNLSWREPPPQLGGGPDLRVDGKITVAGLTGPEADITAELELIDPRGQTKECQLIVPAQADIHVEPPPGLSYELIRPGPKRPHPVLRFLEPNTEPWKVSISGKLRPGPDGHLPIGPFYVQGAKQQRGTITVQTPPELVRAQRLVYHYAGEVRPRARPKGPEEAFEYSRLPDPLAKGPGARVPLEVEITRGGPLQAAIEQTLKLRPGGESWEIELTAQITMKSPAGVGEFLDLQLPRPRPMGVALLAAAPWRGPIGGFPWSALAQLRGALPMWAMPLEFQLSDEAGNALKLPPVDGYGRCRVPRKGQALKLTGRYAVPADGQRVRVDLPFVRGLPEPLEPGSKVTVIADESKELFDVRAGKEIPVPQQHRYQYQVTAAPRFVDVAWRAYHPEFAATALVDVVIRGQAAHVRERLGYGAMPKPAKGAGQIELHVPDGVHGLAVVHGGAKSALKLEKRTAWLLPPAEDSREVVLEYDLLLAAGKGEQRTLDLRMVWPRGTTRQQAKVRIWCEPGGRVQLVGGGLWRDHGVEPVKDHDLLPSLVLEADGSELPLLVQLDRMAGTPVAPLVCERGLIAADVGDNGGLKCRARYVVSKVNTDAIIVEFPALVSQCQPAVKFGGHGVAWQPVDDNKRAVRVPLTVPEGAVHPVLEIEYDLPQSTQQGRAFGLVTLVPPSFGAPVRDLRWHVNLPAGDVVAMPLTPGARPVYRWVWSRLLFAPEPAVADADLEAWLLGNGAAGDVRPSGLTFLPAGSEPQRVYFLPRLLWLIAVSVLAVVLFLALYFLRLSRLVLVVFVGLAIVTGLALALTWPALLIAVCYGAQPGVVVIALVLLLLWAWQERYRRQLVFIPGFTRLKVGSSLVRNGKSSKRPREASTIDAPAPLGRPSSVAGTESGSKK